MVLILRVMFDLLSMVFEQDNYLLFQESPPNEFTVGNLVLFAVRDPGNNTIVRYQRKVENLMVTLNHSQLKISNSIHKFIEGENHSDFTFTKLIKSIEKIELLTGIPSNKFKINKLEFAINIQVEQNPTSYLHFFRRYKKYENDKMRHKNQWYGVKWPLTDYALKVYDKTFEVKKNMGVDIGDNILRFEIQYHRSRVIPDVNTLGDLKDKNVILVIFKDFFKKISKISIFDFEDYSELNSRERELYFAGNNPMFWRVERLNRNTAKSKRKKFNEIVDKVGTDKIGKFFLLEIEKKFHQLIRS